MKAIYENSKFKIVGVVDDITICDCCGKKNLHRTIALENEDGSILHYGTTCASRALTGKRSTKNGELIWGRAVRVQKCQDITEAVLEAVKRGEDTKKFGISYTITYGYYTDTGNKKPLRIYYGGDSKPGVEIPADEYEMGN